MSPHNGEGMFNKPSNKLGHLVLASFLTLSAFSNTAIADDQLKAAINAEERADESVRDPFRNPYETLEFFGIKQGMTVVELAPSGGWYTEILGPYLAAEGELVAGHFNMERENAPGYFARAMAAYKERIADENRFGEISILPFDPPAKSSLGEPASADMVVSFRSVHGWKRDGVFADVIKSVHEVLKPGGVFGIVGHRLPENGDDSVFTGYVKQSWVIEMAEANGLTFVEASEVNANPKDTADHTNGVWSLPPALNVDDDAQKELNRQIGESDRFTLKFVKQ
ncbi:MAG: class I SAM-dependent methyltransferase [Alteromonas sp.]